MRGLTGSSFTAAGAILLVGAAWALAAALIPAVPQNIDETIYVLGAEAFAERGALTLRNGFERFGRAEALRPILTVAGPNGLAPQYPSGYFVLSAPFFIAFDIRGMLLLNVLAGLGCLALCRGLAVRLFGDGRVGLAAALLLGLGTYLTDHVLALSPHVLSALVVLATTVFTARAVLGPPERAAREIFLAGLCLGAGAMIRVDVVLAGPPLAIWALLFAARPLALVLPGAIGLLPGLAASTALNWAKFGVALPLTYGRGATGGALDPGAHLWVAGVAGLVLVAAALLRLPAARRRAGWIGLAAIAVLAVAAAVSPRVAGLLGDVWTGVRALFWDMRLNPDPREGVARFDDGLVLFWGRIKTSLLQSLPWLGALAVLVVRPPSPAERPGLALLVIFPAIWALPYLPTAWHGGPGSNLRYFLPALPFLAILGALAGRALLGLAATHRRVARVWFGATTASLAALVLGVGATGGHAAAYLQYALPQWLALFLAIVAAGAALGGRGHAPRAAAGLGIGGAAFGLACLLGVALDPLAAEDSRRVFAQREARFAEMPERSLVVSFYPYLRQLRHEGAYQAWPRRRDRDEPRIDPALTRAAIDAGLPVFVEGERLARLAEGTLDGVSVRPHPGVPGLALYRLEAEGAAPPPR